MVRNSIKPTTLLAATAVALAMSGSAWAEEAADTGESAPVTQGMPIQPGKPMAGPAPVAPAARGELPKSSPADTPALAGQPSEPAPAGDVIAAQADDQALVSDMVGAKAVNPSGEDLGKIEDLIVGKDGKVEGAVLSVGGFLGIGDKQVAVPWDAMTQAGPDQPLVLAMSKDQLEAAPEFMTLADQRAERQAALSPSPGALPAPGAGSQ